MLVLKEIEGDGLIGYSRWEGVGGEVDGEEGRNVSVNAESYLDSLKQVWGEMYFSSSCGCKMEHSLRQWRMS